MLLGCVQGLILAYFFLSHSKGKEFAQSLFGNIDVGIISDHQRRLAGIYQLYV